MPGDQQGRQLHPNIRFVRNPADCVQDRFDIAQGEFAVEMLGKCFQVDVDSSNVRIHLASGFRGDVASGDQNGVKPRRSGLQADVDDELTDDGRIVIGESDRGATMFRGQGDDTFRGYLMASRGIQMSFGDVPVLTEFASEVTSRGTKRKHGGPGVEMRKRLLLDGIDGETGRGPIPVVEEATVFMASDEAESRLSLADTTVSGTQGT